LDRIENLLREIDDEAVQKSLREVLINGAKLERYRSKSSLKYLAHFLPEVQTPPTQFKQKRLDHWNWNLLEIGIRILNFVPNLDFFQRDFSSLFHLEENVGVG